MNKFWRWARDLDAGPEERTLFLDGAIATESWLDDDVTPALFKSELTGGTGDVTVWINSPGGDCFAAAQIYNMLRDYAGKVTVKIDGLAASAASVIAMAGDEVLVSPVSMLMIHNPSTIAMGDTAEMQKAIDMLDEVKNSIMNAYQEKTGLSRSKLSKLMNEETWMDSKKAVELHFADDVITRNILYNTDIDEDTPDDAKPPSDGNNPILENHPSMLFSRHQVAAAFNQKIADHVRALEPEPVKESETMNKPAHEPEPRYKVADLEKRLDLMKQFI